MSDELIWRGPSALRYECPKCGAKPGDRCRTITTGRSTDIHEARWDALERREPLRGETEAARAVAKAERERDEARAERDRAVDQANNIAAEWIVTERERDEARAEVKRLHKLLSEHAADALEDVSHWGGYASEYFQEKWDLVADEDKWKRRRDLNAQAAS